VTAQRRGSIPLAGDARNPDGPGRHGLPAKMISAMRHRQGGLCPICLRELPRVPFVDHDHRAAASHPHPVTRGCPACVRGLLCNGCNLILGHAGDDPAVLRRAVAYLEAWAGR
jgi:hypothetical protein